LSRALSIDRPKNVGCTVLASVYNLANKKIRLKSESVVNPRDPGSNLGADKKSFLILFASFF
jgi:hypothetical protein